MNIHQPVISGSLTVTGSSTFIGNLTIQSGSITLSSGSLSGTSSLAVNAYTASYVLPLSQSLIASGSLSLTGSLSVTGSVFVSGSITATSDLTISAANSTTVAPRVVGISPLPASSAAEFRFGDPFTAFRSGNAQRMQLLSYWGMEIYGNRTNNSLSYAAGTGTDPSLNIYGSVAANPVVVATAAASQTGNIQEWRNSSNTPLASVSNTGNFSTSGSISGSSILATGTITAQTLVVSTISSSVEYSSGSNIFGNSTANTQTFTGSMQVTGSATFIGSVSIGTSSLSYPLTINANTTQTSIGLMSGYSNANARNWGIATNNAAYGDFNIMQSNALAGDPFAAGTSRLYISQAGNISFSQTNTSAKYIYGQPTYNGSAADSASIFFGIGDNLSTYRAGMVAYQSWNGTYTDSLLKLVVLKGGTGNIDAMTITNAGVIGVGVTGSAWNSYYKAIQIGGGGSIYSLTPTGARITMANNLYNNGSNQDVYLLSDFAAKYVMDLNTHNWYYAPSGTSSGVISWTQSMIISGSNVGIGTTSPGAYLDVQAPAGVSNPIVLKTYSNQHGLGFKSVITSTYTSIETNNTSYPLVFNPSGGNVGIGTTTPTNLLSVAGNFNSTTGTSTAGAISPGVSEIMTTGFNLAASTSQDLSYTTLTSSTSWRLIVKGEFANNNEGGGLVSPSAEIEVNSTYPTITAGSTSITFSRNSSTGKLQVTNNNSSFRITFVGVIELLDYPQSIKPTVSKIILGSIGIGTVAPSVALHVSGATNTFQLRVETGGANTTNAYGGIGLSGESSNTKGGIFYVSNGSSYSRGSIVFALNNSTDQSNVTLSDERMRITNGGTVQPGANGTQDLGTSSLRWATVYTSDLDMSNGIGDYTIVEGEEDLFLYNNKTNKVFKFVIQEVDPSTATPKMKKI
jgi:hypothetical protein